MDEWEQGRKRHRRVTALTGVVSRQQGGWSLLHWLSIIVSFWAPAALTAPAAPLRHKSSEIYMPTQASGSEWTMDTGHWTMARSREWICIWTRTWMWIRTWTLPDMSWLASTGDNDAGRRSSGHRLFRPGPHGESGSGSLTNWLTCPILWPVNAADWLTDWLPDWQMHEAWLPHIHNHFVRCYF